jgi:hypothetical protein
MFPSEHCKESSGTRPVEGDEVNVSWSFRDPWPMPVPQAYSPSARECTESAEAGLRVKISRGSEGTFSGLPAPTIKDSGMPPILILALFVAVMFLFPACPVEGNGAPDAGRAGQVFYVDPDEGSDEHSGLGREHAWKRIPGSYTLDNAGLVRARGWTRMRPGDTVMVKSGTTIRNRLVIDARFYLGGTRETPITVTRDPSWGSGPVTFDGSAQAFGRWDAMIVVARRDHIRIDGQTPGGIIVRHAAAGGIVAVGNSEGNRMEGLTLKNVKLFNNLKFNVNLQKCRSFLLENIDVDGNRRDTEESGGFHIGGNGMSCSDGRLVNCRSYNNGAEPRTQAGWTDARIGFWLVNCTNTVFERCSAHDNAGRGFDVGVDGSPPRVITDNIKYVNCDSYNNAAGFGCNLDDVPGDARIWYVNCISRDNIVGWNIYQGPSAYVYNCLAANNRCGIYLDAPPAKRATAVHIRNTVFYRNSDGGGGSADLWVHRADMLELLCDYNHFEGIAGRKATAWNGAYVHEVYPYNDEDAPGSRKRNWYKRHGFDGHSGCSTDAILARFKDEKARDYHPAADSGLGRGFPINDPLLPEIAHDRDGKERPRSGAWDIGPYVSAHPRI